jgi:glycosyltransferase involved in cell wall biosynthesis
VKFSILTPTYNRAHLLHHAYEGLCKQTLRDFEWIVLDDGSTDATEQAVAEFTRTAPFPIHYFRQENRGKHIAMNRGIAMAKGYFVGVLDSDDWYRPEALESCWRMWEQISLSERPRFVGITALTADPSGKIIGTEFPQPILDCDALDLRYKFGVLGDKKGFQRADVLREFPFPEDLGRFVPEGIVWNRIALKYQTRHVNEVWCTMDYQANGLSARASGHVVSSARAYICFNQEFLALPRKLPLGLRLRSSASLIRFSIHTKDLTALRLSNPLIVITILPGIALYLRDRYRVQKALRSASRMSLQTAH